MTSAREESEMTLTFGASWLVPAEATAAWGARAIDHGATLDVPHDRTSMVGRPDGRKTLSGHLQTIDPIRKAEHMLGTITSEEPATIHDDGTVVVQAVRRGGYLYLAAWL